MNSFMNRPFISILILILILILIFIFSSCRIFRPEGKKSALEKKKAEELYNHLQLNKVDYKWLAAKAKIDIDEEGKNTSFAANIRMRTDSVIWISITPALGIEMARVLITEDSVVVMNRLKNEYFITNFNFVSRKLGFPVDFKSLQEIILGNPLLFENEQLAVRADTLYHLLYSTAVLENKIALSPEEFHLKEMKITDKERDEHILFVLKDHKQIENEWFAKERMISSSAKDESFVGIKFTRVETGKTLTFPFSIPDKYERISN